MGTLTGQQINNTYDGLLKLSDSTTGITNSLQAIEDGLGNNTGSRIAINNFTAPNQIAFYQNTSPQQFYGPGAGSGQGSLPGATSQNNLLFTYFYDNGNYSYSAITINVNTPTSTSDVVELLFYDLQFVDDYGQFPNNLIMSGITLPNTGSGFQTITLPSTLSFSGKGGGYYAAVLKITNGGVTPTFRYTVGVSAINNQSYLWHLGFVRNNAGNQYQYGNRASSYTGVQWYFFSGQTTPQIITSADVVSRFLNTTPTSNVCGFSLHTIK